MADRICGARDGLEATKTAKRSPLGSLSPLALASMTRFSRFAPISGVVAGLVTTFRTRCRGRPANTEGRPPR
jgi:hypothetical protein